MKIDETDFKRVMKLVQIRPTKKKILDVNKYYYWEYKANETLDLMNESRSDKARYADLYHQAMLYTLERNKYFRMPKKDVFVFRIVLKHHNSVCKNNKLYADDKGQRAKGELKLLTNN